MLDLKRRVKAWWTRFRRRKWPPWPQRLSWLRKAVNWVIWVGGWDVGPGFVTPVSLFGHRITIQPFGVSVKTLNGWVCFYREGAWKGAKWKHLYWSPNGTPCHSNAEFFWRRA